MNKETTLIVTSCIENVAAITAVTVSAIKFKRPLIMLLLPFVTKNVSIVPIKKENK